MRISTLLGTGAAVTTAAVSGSVATAPAVQSDWYAQLAKPSYQPPRQAFPIVWPALYADIAVVSAATIDELTDKGQVAQRRSYVAALLLNMVLNAGWSWIFFNRHRLGLATVLSAALAGSSVDLARRSVAVRGVRALPIVLYPLWVGFATVLCGNIAALNRRR